MSELCGAGDGVHAVISARSQRTQTVAPQLRDTSAAEHLTGEPIIWQGILTSRRFERVSAVRKYSLLGVLSYAADFGFEEIVWSRPGWSALSKAGCANKTENDVIPSSNTIGARQNESERAIQESQLRRVLH